MGYYIEVPKALNKAKQLVQLHGAELELSPEKFEFGGDKALICVVENGPFDAAGIAFDDQERQDFMNPSDTRVKTWLTLPKAKAIELCPRVKDVLV